MARNRAKTIRYFLQCLGRAILHLHSLGFEGAQPVSYKDKKYIMYYTINLEEITDGD